MTGGEQLSLVDAVERGIRTAGRLEGRNARDAAVQRADDHADTAWKTAAVDAVRTIARERSCLSSDHVWQWLAQFWPEQATHEHRAMGPVMQHAAREGWIVATERWEQSARPSRHAAPIRVWRSLIHRQEVI